MEFNSPLFMEEVQKFPAIYKKFCKDYKKKFIRMNNWKTIGEKFGLDAAEAEKKYIHENVRTAYGRYLREKTSVPSGSGRDAVPPPAEFSNLDWLVNHINQRPSTVTNMQSRDESEGDAYGGFKGTYTFLSLFFHLRQLLFSCDLAATFLRRATFLRLSCDFSATFLRLSCDFLATCYFLAT